MATRQIDLGPFGETVRANVARRRRELDLTAQELADRTSESKKPIGRSAVSEIERGARRIDVDDLVTLAIALETNPTDLLTSRDPSARVAIGGMEFSPALIQWWMDRMGASIEAASMSGPGPASELARIEEELDVLDEELRHSTFYLAGLAARIRLSESTDDPDLPLYQAEMRKESERSGRYGPRIEELQLRRATLEAEIFKGSGHGDD